MAQDPATPAAPAADPANPTPAADPANPAPAANPADPAPAADPASSAPAADPANPTPDPAKPADPAKAEGDPDDTPADPAPIELILPEGYTLDEELGGKFKEFCASKNLSSEDAQALLDLQLQLREKESQAYQAEQGRWVEQVRTDKEIGGANFDANLAVAKSALDAFGTPELKGLLKSTGFGNHPEVIRAFVKIGKAVGEDKLVVRTHETPQPAKTKDPVSMYSNSKMNP